jgi:hypothetical protein
MAVKMRTFVGRLSRKNESWEVARKELRVTESDYTSPEMRVDSDVRMSPYHALFDKGADIYPRNLWFVKVEKHEVLGLSEEQPFVHTDEAIKSKPPWDKVRISGPVERRFLFATVLGDDLIPFGILHYKPIVLPILIEQNKVSIIDGPASARRLGYSALSDYLALVQESWDELGKSKKLGLYQWLDFRRKLTRQDPTRGYKVVYTGSATYLTAAAIDMTQSFSVSVDGIPFRLTNFIAESKTYQYETKDKGEAFYLTAVLNSTLVDEAIKPLQTQGLFGARDIHKRPLTLPIPKYDATNPLHQSLAGIGERAQNHVARSLGDFQEGGSIGRTRGAVRKLVREEVEAIDSEVRLLLKEQANLET